MDYLTERFAGVDWATDAHAVCVVDDRGAVVAEFDVAHSACGLAEHAEAGATQVCLQVLNPDAGAGAIDYNALEPLAP